MDDYSRFLVLTTGRTGSMWLTDALNSHSQIICFGSVFEARADYVSYDVEGYDNFSDSDRALRDRDCAAFLRERIFGRHGPGVRAVGFKLQYRNLFGFPDLREHLLEDRKLKVIHLRRRDLLRSLISLRLAKATGRYHKQPVRVGWRKVATALRHPARAIGRLRVRAAQRQYRPPGLLLTKEECEQYFRQTRRSERRFDSLFAAHERFDLLYEEMVDDFEAALTRVQEFLGVSSRTLTSVQERVNTAPNRDLVRNYDELRSAFQGTQYEKFFSEAAE